MNRHPRVWLAAVCLLAVALVAGWVRSQGRPKSRARIHHFQAASRAATIPKSGYVLQDLRVIRGERGRAPSYSVGNNPACTSGLTRTGDDSFFIDDTGVLRHSGNPGQPAGRFSPPVR